MPIMEPSQEAAYRGVELAPDALGILQAATRLLAGVALRSLDVLDGAVTLPQFRILAVLADFGRARSAQVAQALGIEASAVTRFADRMVAAGYVSRDDEPGRSDAVALELSAAGEDLVGQVTAWREQELARILDQLPLAERAILTHALRQLVEATGEGYGAISLPDASAT
jgi:DNA-binding MarR family transcriptional regulator